MRWLLHARILRTNSEASHSTTPNLLRGCPVGLKRFCHALCWTGPGLLSLILPWTQMQSVLLPGKLSFSTLPFSKLICHSLLDKSAVRLLRGPACKLWPLKIAATQAFFCGAGFTGFGAGCRLRGRNVNAFDAVSETSDGGLLRCPELIEKLANGPLPSVFCCPFPAWPMAMRIAAPGLSLVRWDDWPKPT